MTNDKAEDRRIKRMKLRMSVQATNQADQSDAAGCDEGQKWATNLASRLEVQWFARELQLRKQGNLKFEPLAVIVWREQESLAAHYAEAIQLTGHDPESWWMGFARGVVTAYVQAFSVTE